MQSTIINGSKQIDFSSLTYTDPKPVGQAKVVNVKMNGKSLQVSTPLMGTWGASDYEGNEKFELSLLFPREADRTASTDAFLQNMKDLREQVVKDILANSKKWLGKTFKDVSIVEELFTPILKYRKFKEGPNAGELDMNSDPSIRAKFQQYNGVYQCNVYDENSQPLWIRDNASSYESTNRPMDYFKKGMMIRTIIECGGIWLIGGKNISLTWKIMQAVTQKPPDSVFSAGCLLNISDGDKAAITSAQTEDSEGEPAGHQISTTVESSDEEEEEEVEVEVEEEEEEEEEEEAEPEPEPEPEPVKPVKKKVVRTKKAA